jgi:thiamine-monophosphate kinase
MAIAVQPVVFSAWIAYVHTMTEISAVGEFGLIARIREIANFRVNDPAIRENLLAGIGDDTAVYRPSPGKVQLLTTDAFIEGIHFDLTFTSFKHLGWKALVANVSDIAATGGTPQYALVTLSLPKKITVEMVEEFYAGMASACKQYNCLLVGGDTTASMANLMVSVTLTGEAEERHLTYRSGAREGEYICATGHLGASLAGLKVLQREKQRFQDAVDKDTFQPQLEPYAAALEKHLMPRPRLDIARLFREDVKVGAVIDISDGLASEVHHICASSGVGAEVYEHNVPIAHVTGRIAEELSLSPADFALYGGEEYELLFTISEGEYGKLDRLTNDVTILGRVKPKEQGVILVSEHGERELLRSGGWDHFR